MDIKKIARKVVISRLVERVNPKTGEKVWALISKSKGRVLKYFGKKKPSEERILKEERRVQWFKRH